MYGAMSLSQERRYHVSKNRLGGSLAETPISKLLESCREHLITGTITIETPLASGRIELRAGGVFEAQFEGAAGEPAMVQMRALKQGTYELAQRLPSLNGALASAAECRGDLRQTSLIEIMRHCEDQALSCTITIVSDFERAEINYRAGDITGVLLNGKPDEDAVVDVVKWGQGQFRITVPPLALDIDGWPSADKDPTMPFTIADMAKLPPPKRTPAAPQTHTPAPQPQPPAPSRTRAARASVPPPIPTVPPAARPAAMARASRPAPAATPIRESFQPRLDPSGQLALRADTLLGDSRRAGSTLALLGVGVAFAAMWVVIAMMVGAL